MNALEARALRDHAAVMTYRRIQGDEKRTSQRISPLVACIAEHLFDPGLTYGRVRTLCGVKDNNRTTLFRQALGLTPAAYIRDCRMEVACRLLRDSSLDVARIGELVGYVGPQVFTPAFRRCVGMTPTAYRRLQRPMAEAAAAAPRRWVPDTQPSTWRRFVTGGLELAEASLFFRHFLSLYPEVRRRLLLDLIATLRDAKAAHSGRDRHDPALVAALSDRAELDSLVPRLGEMLTREDLERLLAETTWEDLRDRPWSEQVERIRHQVRFETPALFRRLGAESCRLAPHDPDAALRLARLALEHAATLHAADTDDGTHPWKALAWAWIGNAKRAAHDFEGARRAFEAAERRVVAGTGTNGVPSLRSEVASFRAALELELASTATT